MGSANLPRKPLHHNPSGETRIHIWFVASHILAEYSSHFKLEFLAKNVKNICKWIQNIYYTTILPGK